MRIAAESSDNPISALACLLMTESTIYIYTKICNCTATTTSYILQADDFVIEATKEGENADVNNLFSLLAKCVEMLET